jgi:beta-N-acetylhexosaminidase
MEFRTGSFDRLIGNGWVREALEDGDEVETIEARWRDGLEAFKARREAHLLY